MTKYRRFKYGIKELKEAGMNYIDIGKIINEMKKLNPVFKNCTFYPIKSPWYKRFINFIKKIYENIRSAISK